MPKRTFVIFKDVYGTCVFRWSSTSGISSISIMLNVCTCSQFRRYIYGTKWNWVNFPACVRSACVLYDFEIGRRNDSVLMRTVAEDGGRGVEGGGHEGGNKICKMYDIIWKISALSFSLLFTSLVEYGIKNGSLPPFYVCSFRDNVSILDYSVQIILN